MIFEVKYFQEQTFSLFLQKNNLKMNENKKCVKCGETINGDAAFCPFCGSAQPKSTPTPPPFVAPQASNNQHTFLIVGLVAAVVVIAVLLVVLVMKNTEGSKDQPFVETTEGTAATSYGTIDETPTDASAAAETAPVAPIHRDAYASDTEWVSEEYLSESDLAGYTKAELRILRNSIFARHGYIFNSDDLYNHFAQFGWYNPVYDDVNSMLSKTEKHNVNLIKKLEK